MTKSLWGEISIDEEVVPPVTLLKEQAAELERLTQHVLKGEVEVDRHDDTFNVDFYVTAPLLENYKYWVLRLRHSIEMFPAKLLPAQRPAEEWIVCDNESELVREVAKVLSSLRVRKAISMLLAQSKALS
ncbi:MAG: hypothetical protein JWO56_7 [Acidobacteria bacterium]|nr:hypothetical protein [Acidobacteriota bacterium]